MGSLVATRFSRRNEMPVRDAKGRWLKGAPGGKPGRMTEAKAVRLKLAEAESILENSDEMPLDHLLKLMRSRGEPRDVRFAAPNHNKKSRAS
jgi:hypothetical protein